MSQSAARLASQDVTKEQLLQKAEQVKPAPLSQNVVDPELAYQIERFIIQIEGLCWPMDDVRRVLASRVDSRPRVLDIGSSLGEWVSDMAKEFPQADVLGIDVAPVRPADAPSNCSFEAVDLASLNIDHLGQFDVIRVIRPGRMGNQAAPLLSKALDMVKPKGLFLIVDVDNTMFDENRDVILPASKESDSGKASWWARFLQEAAERLPPSLFTPYKNNLNFSECMQEDLRLEDFKLRRQFIPLGIFSKDEKELCDTAGLPLLALDLVRQFVEGVRPKLLQSGLAEAELDTILRGCEEDCSRLKTYVGWFSYAARKREH